MDKIQSFEDINKLYHSGINICIGCEFEHTASCTPDRFPICTKQLKLTMKDRENSTTEYTQNTIPEIIGEIAKLIAKMQVLCGINKDTVQATLLTQVQNDLQKAESQLKLYNFETRQTALW